MGYKLLNNVGSRYAIGNWKMHVICMHAGNFVGQYTILPTTDGPVSVNIAALLGSINTDRELCILPESAYCP